MENGQIAPIERLGDARIDSPILSRLGKGNPHDRFVGEHERVLVDDTQEEALARSGPVTQWPSFELAGARKKIYFDPNKLKVGIVTCGGLCPGMNNVIAGLVQELRTLYGVTSITGFRNGYRGFIAKYGHDTVDLSHIDVQPIRSMGGSILGTSRGNQDPIEIVDALEQLGIGALFVIGGDGTMRGAMTIVEEITKRQRKIAVICIPKTIDNDICVIDQSFGFQTAFAEAAHAIKSGYVEATAAPNGLSIIKLMGRYSGFIACYASLADTSADVVLIPEVPFEFDGDGGLLAHIEKRLLQEGHVVVVTAEGAGQDHFAETFEVDASGNRKLQDIGGLLRRRVQDYFADRGIEISLKYIDPSYAIRSVAANAYDSVYCIQLAQAAVHAAMSGLTGVVVGRFHRKFVHLPIPMLVETTNQVDPKGDLWWSVLENTGQPEQFVS